MFIVVTEFKWVTPLVTTFDDKALALKSSTHLISRTDRRTTVYEIDKYGYTNQIGSYANGSVSGECVAPVEPG